MSRNNEIEKILNELFKLIGIEVGIQVVEEKQEEETFYKVQLDPKESTGLLIGSHGMTLASLQSFLTIALKQKTGDWVKVGIDIGNWSEKQNDRLSDLAQSTSERAKQTGEEQRLYNLTAAERRIIHMALAEDSEIETVSEGEGRDRCLIVRLKK